jgi:hypothetical protein
MCYVFLTLRRNHRCVEEKKWKTEMHGQKRREKRRTKVDGHNEKTKKKKNGKQKLM